MVVMENLSAAVISRHADIQNPGLKRSASNVRWMVENWFNEKHAKAAHFMVARITLSVILPPGSDQLIPPVPTAGVYWLSRIKNIWSVSSVNISFTVMRLIRLSKEGNLIRHNSCNYF
jgi:hypothetical protein